MGALQAGAALRARAHCSAELAQGPTGLPRAWAADWAAADVSVRRRTSYHTDCSAVAKPNISRRKLIAPHSKPLSLMAPCELLRIFALHIETRQAWCYHGVAAALADELSACVARNMYLPRSGVAPSCVGHPGALAVRRQGAPAERVHRVGYHNLNGGRPVVGDSQSTALGPSLGHTSARRGCSWMQQAAALGQHAAAAAAEGMQSGHHSPPVDQHLHRRRPLPGIDPSTAVDTAARMDLEHCIAGTAVVSSTAAAGCAAERSSHRCCMQLDWSEQSAMVEQLRLLVHWPGHRQNIAVRFPEDLEEAPSEMLYQCPAPTTWTCSSCIFCVQLSRARTHHRRSMALTVFSSWSQRCSSRKGPRWHA